MDREAWRERALAAGLSFDADYLVCVNRRQPGDLRPARSTCGGCTASIERHVGSADWVLADPLGLADVGRTVGCVHRAGGYIVHPRPE